MYMYMCLLCYSYSPTVVVKGDKKTDGVSSDDFTKYMMSLQNSTNIVEDPGKSLSATNYTGRKGIQTTHYTHTLYTHTHTLFTLHTLHTL